jgi:hypothetical protein
MAFIALSDYIRRTCHDDSATSVTPLWSKINYPIGRSNEFNVVLD